MAGQAANFEQCVVERALFYGGAVTHQDLAAARPEITAARSVVPAVLAQSELKLVQTGRPARADCTNNNAAQRAAPNPVPASAFRPVHHGGDGLSVIRIGVGSWAWSSRPHMVGSGT